MRGDAGVHDDPASPCDVAEFGLRADDLERDAALRGIADDERRLAFAVGVEVEGVVVDAAFQFDRAAEFPRVRVEEEEGKRGWVVSFRGCHGGVGLEGERVQRRKRGVLRGGPDRAKLAQLLFGGTLDARSGKNVVEGVEKKRAPGRGKGRDVIVHN